MFGSTSTRVEATGQFPAAVLQQPAKRFNDMDSDLATGVWLYSVVIKHYKNPMNEQVAVAFSYTNPAMAALQGTAVKDDLYEAAGVPLRGTGLVMKPGTSEDVDWHPVREMAIGFQSPGFIATTALLNERNLMNGIIVLPEELCKEAGLGTWKGDYPEPSEDMLERMMGRVQINDRKQIKATLKERMESAFEGRAKSTFMYAVPRNHVLAWALQSASVREQFRLLGTREIRVNGVVLYYLVLSEDFHQLRAYCVNAWLNKTDRVRMDTIGFTMLPPSEGASFRTYVKYLSMPAISQRAIDNLAPTLAPNFLPVSVYSEDDMDRDMALQEYAETKARDTLVK